MTRYFPNNTVKIDDVSINADLFDEATKVYHSRKDTGAGVVITPRFVIFIGHCIVPIKKFEECLRE